jgi:hypothetical protein
MKKVLVIGFSSRNIAASACRAGYEVYAIDAFCDRDLQACTKCCHALPGEKNKITQAELAGIIDILGIAPDAVVLGSGFEFTGRGIVRCPVLNNPPEIMERTADKKAFAEAMKLLGIPHPATWPATDPPEIGRPMIIKPVRGGGGIFNRVVNNEEELDQAVEIICAADPGLTPADLILQEMLEGIPASVSVISTGKRATAVSVNEQLTGVEWLTDMPFAYCGNITPLQSPWRRTMEMLAEKLCNHFGLVGSNGIDFILTEKGPVVLEINARFQGSLDTVEKATGINLFAAHVKAFAGKLPGKTDPVTCAGRAVIYAGEAPVEVNPGLSGLMESGNFADIPLPGSSVLPDEPLVSVIETGKSREEVLGKLRIACGKVRDAGKTDK